MIVLQATSLCKRWNASSGLEPLSFDLSYGSLVVVKGRSGSGKSTLLALLAGWCEPDSGSIDRRGDWSTGREWMRWRHTSVVPQVLANVAELTVRENIEAPIRLDDPAMRGRRARSSLAAVVDRAVAGLDLADLVDRTPGEISVGQQQRLAVARAVVLRPTLVLADEPTSHQDSGHATAVMSVLRAVTDAGSAVLVASHDPVVVAAADVIIDLDV